MNNYGYYQVEDSSFDNYLQKGWDVLFTKNKTN